MKRLLMIFLAAGILLTGCTAEREGVDCPVGPPVACTIDGFEEYFKLADAAELADGELESFLRENGYESNMIGTEEARKIVKMVERAPVPVITGNGSALIVPRQIVVLPEEEWNEVTYYYREDFRDRILWIEYHLDEAEESGIKESELGIEKIKAPKDESERMIFWGQVDGIPVRIALSAESKKDAVAVLESVKFLRTGGWGN